MSAGSKGSQIDHARGWLYAEGLLLEAKVARLEGVEGAELEAELRADGVDAARVPGAEELVARATARARAQEEGVRPGVDHARGWGYVEGLAAEEDGEEKGGKAEGESEEKVPSLQRLIARAEELAREEKETRGGAKAPEAEDAGAKRPVPVGESRERKGAGQWLRAVWLVAAALGIVLLVLGVMNRRAIVALFKGEEIRPDDQWVPWERGPTREEQAAKLRESAFAACDAHLWTECAKGLDAAKQMDPAGESAERVIEARRAIERGRQREDGLKPGEHGG